MYICIYINADKPASVRRESKLGERGREALLSVSKHIDVNMHVSICTSIHTNTCSFMYR